MKFGVYMIASPNNATQGPYSKWIEPSAAAGDERPFPHGPWVKRYARTAEALGFNAVWMSEHTVLPTVYTSRYPYQQYAEGQDFHRYPLDEAPFPEPVSTMSFMAGATETIRFRTAVMVIPRRNPVLLANELATLDMLSGARVDVGIGVGWWREEFEAMGVPWEARGRRTDECIEAMRALWGNEVASYHGTTVSFDKVRLNPRPLNGAVPIIIGGHGEAAVRRAVRLGDGIVPLSHEGVDWAPLMEKLDREAETAGRDPATIKRYAGTDAELRDVERLAKLGVEEFYIVTPPGSIDAACDFMEEVAGRMQQYL